MFVCMYVSAGKSCECQHITDAEINVYKNRNACNGFSLEIVWKAPRKICSWRTGTIAPNALCCERARWDKSLVSIKRSRSPRSSLQIKAIVQTRFQGFSYSPGDEHEGIVGTRFAIAVIHSLHRSRFCLAGQATFLPNQQWIIQRETVSELEP